MTQVVPVASNGALERVWNDARDGSEEHWQNVITNVQRMLFNKVDDLSLDLLTSQKQLEQSEVENKQLREQVANLQAKCSMLASACIGSASSPCTPTSSVRSSRQSRAPISSRSLPKVPLMPIPEEDGVSERSPRYPSPPTETSGILLSVERPRSPELLKTESLAIPSPVIFTITLRKADGCRLGVTLSYTDDALALLVDEIASGAVAAWNRMVGATKMIRCGDKFVGVNDITRDARRMFAECEEKQLLKIAILRQTGADARIP